MGGELAPDQIIAAFALHQHGIVARRQLVAGASRIVRSTAGSRRAGFTSSTAGSTRSGTAWSARAATGGLHSWHAATMPSSVTPLLHRCAGQPGTAALREVLERYAPGSVDVRSRLEEMCIELRDAHGILRPSTNMVVAGRVRDLYWPHAPLVVEVDSYRWHRSPSRLSEERALDVSLALLRIPFLRFSYEQVADEPRYVVSAVLAALGASSPPMR